LCFSFEKKNNNNEMIGDEERPPSRRQRKQVVGKPTPFATTSRRSDVTGDAKKRNIPGPGSYTIEHSRTNEEKKEKKIFGTGPRLAPVGVGSTGYGQSSCVFNPGVGSYNLIQSWDLKMNNRVRNVHFSTNWSTKLGFEPLTGIGNGKLIPSAHARKSKSCSKFNGGFGASKTKREPFLENERRREDPSPFSYNPQSDSMHYVTFSQKGSAAFASTVPIAHELELTRKHLRRNPSFQPSLLLTVPMKQRESFKRKTPPNSSAAFGSTSSRLDLESKQTVPGPGAYHFQKKKSWLTKLHEKRFEREQEQQRKQRIVLHRTNRLSRVLKAPQPILKSKHN